MAPRSARTSAPRGVGHLLVVGVSSVVGDLWLPDFQAHVFSDKTGGTYDRLDPKKVLLHTTEGTTVAGAMRAYENYPPHVIVDFVSRERVQHIPLNWCAYSLRRSESDDEPVIQVEIVGFAEQAPNWTPGALQWLATDVLAPIHRLWPFELQGPPQGFHGPNDGIKPYLASKDSPIRFSATQFRDFGGICGHQHAPSPDVHWDPGKLDIESILGYLKAELAQDRLANTDNTDRVAELERRTGELELRLKIIGSVLHLADSPFDLVAALYRNVLKREPDDEGLLYWTDKLSKSTATPLDVIDALLEVRPKEPAQ